MGVIWYHPTVSKKWVEPYLNSTVNSEQLDSSPNTMNRTWPFWPWLGLGLESAVNGKWPELTRAKTIKVKLTYESPSLLKFWITHNYRHFRHRLRPQSLPRSLHERPKLHTVDKGTGCGVRRLRHTLRPHSVIMPMLFRLSYLNGIFILKIPNTVLLPILYYSSWRIIPNEYQS